MNEEIMNIYKSLLQDMYKINPNIVITGSVATVLYLNNIHRICNDIDIHFADDYSIVRLINQINYTNAKYEIIDYSVGDNNISIKLKKNSGHQITLDIYNNSLIDHQEVNGMKLIKLEKLIVNKLINCVTIKNSTNPRIKDLYDLQFLLRLKYGYNLIFYYLCRELLEIYKIDKLFNNVINELCIGDFYEDIFNKYKANNYTTEDLKLKEIKDMIIQLKDQFHSEGVKQ